MANQLRPTPHRPVIDRILLWLPVLAAVTVGVLVGVRVLSAEDLGYHVVYGDRFLETGHPLDHDDFLYTLPATDTAVAHRPQPGPGSWYDQQGRYRFANANWLSEVFNAVAYRVGGVAGLNAQLIMLVALLLGLIVWLMRRLEVPPLAISAAVLALVLVSYPRLTLRPELFGYIVLVAQACIFAVIWREGRFHRSLPRTAVAGLIGLQLLFVNLHSYFILGLALTGAILVGSLADRNIAPPGRRVHLVRLAIVAAGQVAVCFVNPWTWRLAFLPAQTIMFLHRNNVADGPAAHPWTSMGELHRPVLFEQGWTTNIAALGFVACLAVIAAGAVAALRRRRWDWLLLMTGMTLVGFAAQRNIAVGMITAVPFALAALTRAPWWPSVKSWSGGHVARLAGGRVTETVAYRVAAVAAFLAATGLGVSVVTNTLYVSQDSPIRFGGGLSRLHLPIGAAKWITEHDVSGRIWTSPLCSSTISGFVKPRPRLNMVTCTWAYPPAVMQNVLLATSSYGPQPFGPTADRFDVSVVVTQAGLFLHQLAMDHRWVPVHVEGRFTVLVRRDGPDGHLADRDAVEPHDLDTEAMIQHARSLDPAPGLALWLSAQVLTDLGWYDQALQLLAASRQDNPSESRTWIATANALTRRAMTREPRTTADLAAVRDDFEQVAEALQRAWELTGDPELAVNMGDIRQRLRQLNRQLAWVHQATSGVRP